MPWRKSHHHLRHHGFMFILSVRLWRRPIRVPMVGFLCWDDMLMNVFLLWFGFLPFFFFFFFFSSLYFVSVVMAGWHWMNCVFFDRICRSSHPHRNWWLRIFMQMNGDLNISSEVIAYSSFFYPSSLLSTFVFIFYCVFYRLWLMMSRFNFRSTP